MTTETKIINALIPNSEIRIQITCNKKINKDVFEGEFVFDNKVYEGTFQRNYRRTDQWDLKNTIYNAFNKNPQNFPGVEEYFDSNKTFSLSFLTNKICNVKDFIFAGIIKVEDLN